MTVPARYTLTEAHFKIAELEREKARLQQALDDLDELAQYWLLADRQHRSSADYIDRTIATVRNHRDADNCWPQWANIFADEIEDLRADVLALVNVAKAAEQLRRPEGRVYCKGGDETCEDCVGSCGIEEWQEFREALAALNKEPA